MEGFVGVWGCVSFTVERGGHLTRALKDQIEARERIRLREFLVVLSLATALGLMGLTKACSLSGEVYIFLSSTTSIKTSIDFSLPLYKTTDLSRSL